MTTTTNATGTTRTEANRQHVIDVYDAFARGDIATILGQFTADGRLVSHGPSTSPLTGQYTGDSIAQYFVALGQSMDVTRFEVTELLAQGDTVVALVDLAFTVRATGASYQGPVVQVINMRDGRTTKFEVFASEDEQVWA